MEQSLGGSTEFSYGHVKVEINLRYPRGDFKTVVVM